MADIPKCRNPECSRSQTRIIKEHPDFLTVACLTCGSIHVLSTIEAKKRARHQTIAERRERRDQAERAVRRKRMIFS